MLRDNLAGAHLADVQQARELTLSRCALTGTRSSDDRPPNALKIPARQGGIYALTENGASPLHAEPRQTPIRLSVVPVGSSEFKKYSAGASPLLMAGCTEAAIDPPIVRLPKCAKCTGRLWIRSDLDNAQ